MIRKNFHLTPRQIDFLGRCSHADSMSVAEHLRRAIDEYLKKMGAANLPQTPPLPHRPKNKFTTLSRAPRPAQSDPGRKRAYAKFASRQKALR